MGRRSNCEISSTWSGRISHLAKHEVARRAIRRAQVQSLRRVDRVSLACALVVLAVLQPRHEEASAALHWIGRPSDDPDAREAGARQCIARNLCVLHVQRVVGRGFHGRQTGIHGTHQPLPLLASHGQRADRAQVALHPYLNLGMVLTHQNVDIRGDQRRAVGDQLAREAQRLEVRILLLARAALLAQNRQFLGGDFAHLRRCTAAPHLGFPRQKAWGAEVARIHVYVTCVHGKGLLDGLAGESMVQGEVFHVEARVRYALAQRCSLVRRKQVQRTCHLLETARERAGIEDMRRQHLGRGRQRQHVGLDRWLRSRSDGRGAVALASGTAPQARKCPGHHGFPWC
ncbi:hypothetical protein [Cupriavidus sp. H39]|uniref:hypothetical protein n=1 Tax=Cupriavidus sp. H39 TaxID=3401635 RepID=UPI003CFF2818